MRCTIKLTDVHYVVFVFEDGGFVVVNVEVIGRGEYGHYAGEVGDSCFFVHSVAGVLGFVGTYYTE